MSGGVDSSVAALTLLRAGREVQGLFMSNWEEDEDGYCTSAEDFQDARRVTEELGIPLHRVSFAREYRDQVFRHFLDEYAAGRTPNPDVLCNREIKFGVCLAYARRLGAARFATGHYARIGRGPDGPTLLRAADRGKDQSYFLHAVDRAALSISEFPVGELPKDEVRERARQAGLPVFAKRDSTGICFIGERPFRRFLEGYLPAQPGPIETDEGEVVGEHGGLMYYTLGQRAGLGIGGRRGALDAPWYVAAKDLARNALVVVQDAAHPLLMSVGLEAEQVHWIAGDPPDARVACAVQVRYRQPPQACVVTIEGTDRARVAFEKPQRAVTPGQYAVFYDGDRCLGGGVIAAARIGLAGRPPRAATA